MPGFGFMRVPMAGFVGFMGTLRTGGWNAVTVPNGMYTGSLDPSATAGLSLFPRWKLRLMRAVTAAAAVTNTPQPLAALDNAWDDAERRLDLLIEFAEHASDPATRALGARLRAALFPTPTGARSPVLLAYGQEVDYGTAQITKAALPDVHADIVAANLASVMSEVTVATQALAEGIGAIPGSTRKKTPHYEARVAHADCVTAFNQVLADMEWFLSSTVDGTARATAQTLYQTLVDLVDRYPKKSIATATSSTTTATHPTATTPTTPTGTPDVTIIPAGTGTAATPTTPGAAAPQAPVRAPVTAPTSPRRAHKATTRTRIVRVPPAAKKAPVAIKKRPTTVKKVGKKK